MPLDKLPNKLTMPTRADLVAQYKGDVQFRAPAISTDNGTLPDVDANVVADLVLPVYVESSRQASINTLDGQNGAELDQTCTDFGIPTKLPAAGASGFVQVTTSTGGASIAAGQEIRNLVTGYRYQCAASGVYTPANNLVPVTGVDTGPQTNAAASTVLTWTSPPPGLLPQGTVFRNSDGSGLTGGANGETDPEQRDRIRASRALPAVSGNDAAYQRAVSGTPGLAIGGAFTYPAILGPGSTGVAFLLRPSLPGAGRIPSAAQIGLVRANVVGQMPKDDSASFCLVIGEPVDIVLKVRWALGAASWTDGTAAWPPASAVTYPYTVSGSPTPTVFTVSTSDPGAVAPQAGETIGFFVISNLVTAPDSVFVRKRILTARASIPAGSWLITVDTSNGASDTQFAPAVGDRVMPWSDSLSALTAPIVSFFDSLGIGEQETIFFDDGYRQRRSPPDPKYWPASLTNRALVPIEGLGAVQDVQIASPSTPLAPTVGTPGVSSYLLTLRSLSVYAL